MDIGPPPRVRARGSSLLSTACEEIRRKLVAVHAHSVQPLNNMTWVPNGRTNDSGVHADSRGRQTGGQRLYARGRRRRQRTSRSDRRAVRTKRLTPWAANAKDAPWLTSAG